MTEFELIEAAAISQSFMQGWVTKYFAALTAYLIAGYLVVASLTTRQVVTVNAGFLIFAFLAAYGAMGTGTRMLEFVQEMEAINPNRGFAMNVYALVGASTTLYIGIILTLKFMWDIRHPKTE